MLKRVVEGAVRDHYVSLVCTDTSNAIFTTERSARGVVPHDAAVMARNLIPVTIDCSFSI